MLAMGGQSIGTHEHQLGSCPANLGVILLQRSSQACSSVGMKLVTVLGNEDYFSCLGRKYAHANPSVGSLNEEVRGPLSLLRSIRAPRLVFEGPVRFNYCHPSLLIDASFLAPAPFGCDKFDDPVLCRMAHQSHGLSSLLYETNLIDQHLPVKRDAAVRLSEHFGGPVIDRALCLPRHRILTGESFHVKLAVPIFSVHVLHR